MESSYQEILQRLKSQLQDLITLYEQSEIENMQLFEENKRLKEELQKSNERVGNLESSNENLKLARGFALNQDESEDAKQKVNQMVREIDKCIALLNK
ncbi:MAG: hypothetical protein GVY19_09425 [Bacteroidetes bacterium]|jgi:exonuclease VII large subunit|nr:hypothetical protein [Bacteroidota bacterium]